MGNLIVLVILVALAAGCEVYLRRLTRQTQSDRLLRR